MKTKKPYKKLLGFGRFKSFELFTERKTNKFPNLIVDEKFRHYGSCDL